MAINTITEYIQYIFNTLDVCELIEIKKGKKVEIIFPYNQDKRINYLLSNITILEKYFEENIRYIFNISNDDLNILTDNNISYNILEDNIYI